MAFQKGQSGNPKGRPKGTTVTRDLIQQIESNAPAIIQTVIDKAIEGDMRACKLLLDRIIPSLSSTDLKIYKEDLPINDGISQETEDSIKRVLLGVNTRPLPEVEKK